MRRFIECLIPTTQCNLKCSYCYVIQENRRRNEKAIFKYSAKHIAKALSIKRIGGISLISMTASGETLIPKEMPGIIREILKEGHFVNITTNGTITKQFTSLMNEIKGYEDHLHISFSLHYIELKKKNLVEVFFNNIKLVHSQGCSILVQINLADEYLPYWDEIKRICIENIGAAPQVALTRKEINGTYELFSELSWDEYIAKGREMESPLFEFTCNNFMKKHTEYCYAGYWSAKLNLGTGEMTGCYGAGIHQNIFENISKPIKWEPIGHRCPFKYCINSSHFISQGIMPDLKNIPSYGELRNRDEAHWYSNKMKDFLYKKLYSENKLLKKIHKYYYEIIYRIKKIKTKTE